MRRRIFPIPFRLTGPCFCAALLVATAAAQPADEWRIDTVAGIGGFGGDGGPAVLAHLNRPESVAVDGAGNLYIADNGNKRIRRVDNTTGVITTVAGLNTDSTLAVDGLHNIYVADTSRIHNFDVARGIFTTVAGSGKQGFSGDGGPAIAAELSQPEDVAVDAAGNIYIADKLNHRIRKVDAATGIITTVAGNGNNGFSGDGGPAIAAELHYPHGVAVDAAGNIYIADSGNQRIRKVDAATGIITTTAGNGTPGFRGDGGPAVQAELVSPRSVAVDGTGNLYFDNGQRIRKVDAASDIITTVAGNGNTGFSGDGGPAVQAHLKSPQSVALDNAGNIYIADGGDHRIRKIDAATGIITTAAGAGIGPDDVPATEARLATPRDIAVDGAGNIYIVDSSNARIRKVDAATGIITTAAGNEIHGFSGDGGPATQASLRYPRSVAVDTANNLYIAGNARIRKVDAATGIITTVAGNGTPGSSGDGGPAIHASITPSDLAVDTDGNIYLAYFGNHRIRKIDVATGIITTVAGNGNGGFSGDGGPAVHASIIPSGLAVDTDGNIYIAGGHRIRKVDTAAGIITTIAGNGNPGFSGDGGPATDAALHSPSDLVVDGAGNIYIVDTGNIRIRRLTPPPRHRISAGGVVLATGSPVVNYISPNAIVSIFGQGFAPEGAQAASSALDAAGRVATELAGLCLEIDGKRAPLFAVFPEQINAQAPHGLTIGTAQVEAILGCGTRNAQHSFAATVWVDAVSPAFFNFPIDPGGRNPIVALHGDGPALVGLPGDVPGVELTPAEPGEVITLFGTGFGPTEPALEAGQIPGGAAQLAGEVEFTFGGIRIFPDDVLYAGAAPCCAGLYQFTVRVPFGFPDGYAAVTATVQRVSTPEGPFLTVRRRR